MLGRIFTGILFAMGLCGCVATDRSNPAPPEIDGVLDDAVWANILRHPLVQPRDRADAGRILMENGTVRFFHSDGILYLAAEFDDSTLVTAGEKDGDELYHGDCFEVFIKPVGQPFYWEIWISPAGLRSVVKWRKKADLESTGYQIEGREIRASVTINGTLDKGVADDVGWSLAAAIPFPNIPGAEPEAWEILIARQNYDESLSKETRELSSFPQLSKTNFHLTEEYFKMK